METSGGIRASLAGRYASALFDLARDQRQIEAVGRSLDALGQTLLDSKDFNELIASPLVSRVEAGKAFAALAPQLGVDPLTANFLGVLARNGRKGQLRAVIRNIPPGSTVHVSTTGVAFTGGVPAGRDKCRHRRKGSRVEPRRLGNRGVLRPHALLVPVLARLSRRIWPQVARRATGDLDG